MKVNFKTCDCGNYECMITEPHEVDIVKQAFIAFEDRLK